MTNTQIPGRFTIVAQATGGSHVWQVARLTDLAVAGYMADVVTDDGVRVEQAKPRQWIADQYIPAKMFAERLEDPAAQTVGVVVWLRDGKVVA